MTGHTPDRRGARILRIGTSVGLSQFATPVRRGDTEFPLGQDAVRRPRRRRRRRRPGRCHDGSKASRPSDRGWRKDLGGARAGPCAPESSTPPERRMRRRGSAAPARPPNRRRHPLSASPTRAGRPPSTGGWHLAPGAGSRAPPHGTDGGLHPLPRPVAVRIGATGSRFPSLRHPFRGVLGRFDRPESPGECRQPIGPRVDDTGSTGPDKSVLALA